MHLGVLPLAIAALAAVGCHSMRFTATLPGIVVREPARGTVVRAETFEAGPSPMLDIPRASPPQQCDGTAA
jgi:hypothetical protein